MVGPRIEASLLASASGTLAANVGVVLAALFGLAGAVVSSAAGSGLGLTGDSVAYLSSARAIAAGEGSRAIVGDDRPPGFPLLLSPLSALDAMPLRSARVLTVTAMSTTAVLTFLLMRMRISQRLALLVAGLVATNGLLIDHSNYLLSELSFTALAVGALVVFERWRLTRGSPGPASLAIAAALTAAAGLVRIAGLVLVPVGMLAIWAKRSGAAGSRIRAVLIFACMASEPANATTRTAGRSVVRIMPPIPRGALREIHPREFALITARTAETPPRVERFDCIDRLAKRKEAARPGGL